MAERVLGGIFSFFAADEPKVTPQQARDRAQAAGNVEMQHAQAHKAAQQEHDARLQRTLDEIRRKHSVSAAGWAISAAWWVAAAGSTLIGDDLAQVFDAV